MNKFFNLSDDKKKSFLSDQYFNKNKSITEIAINLSTYPNKIRREAQRLGIELKSRNQIYSELSARGIIHNPTKGRERTEEEKDKIALAISESFTDEIKQKISKGAKKRWRQKSKKDKDAFFQKSHEAIRNAAKYGSKLEIFLYEKLIEEGFRCVLHEKHLIGNDQMHLDLLLPQEQIAIEIDGIFHQKIVWDQETYEQKLASDTKKNGLLIRSGYDIIRIKYCNNLSRADMLKIKIELLNCINKDKQYQEIIYE